MIPTQERQHCVGCLGKSLEPLFELPKLPLTGRFVPKTEPIRKDLWADTSLLYCFDCGMSQLSKFIDPQMQYGKNYWFRTSTSPTATSGIDFFIEYFEELTRGRQFSSMVELGCNDLYLLKRIRNRAKKCVGIDSLWQEKEFSDGNLSVQGHLDISERPDLVISEHTFEHLVNPAETLSYLVDSAVDGALFFIEIPSLEFLLSENRFDQIFHQHLNYFGLHALQNLIHRLGCTYLSHRYHPQYWGSLIIAFEKSKPLELSSTPEIGFENIGRSYASFRSRMRNLKTDLDHAASNGPVYGLGAAQIAPMLAYSLGTDFHELAAFLDDDPRKHELKYANLVPEIISFADIHDFSHATLLLTALDYRSRLIKRVGTLCQTILA